MTPPSAMLALAIGLATLAAIAVGEIPRLRMNRATIAIVGATLLLATGVRSLPEAYAAIDGDTLVLLFAMMVLNANLRIAGFFERASSVLVHEARTPRRLLAATIAVSAALSALLLNDTVALGLTPLVLSMTKAAGLDPLPYLMAVATGANIGSSASLVGNPQNIIIGAISHIPFVRFSAVLAPQAAAGCVVAWLLIGRVYRRALARRIAAPPRRDEQPVDRELLRKSLVATGVLLVFLVAGVAVPLAALAAASLLLVTRRLAPERVFAEIDWSLLVFFAGLFVVTGAIDRALASLGVRHLLVAWAGGGVAALTALTAVLSNLVSNVPAVLLLRGPVADVAHPERGWFVLAAASTLAGNLTLLGSVANLIVAELARRGGVTLSFREYLRCGIPITIATLALATLWIAVVL